MEQTTTRLLEGNTTTTYYGNGELKQMTQSEEDTVLKYFS